MTGRTGPRAGRSDAAPRLTAGGDRVGRLESRWAIVDGRRMHARVSAEPVPPERTPVVLVHGMVLSSRFMAPLAVRLAPEYRVHAPDLPGFGSSKAPPGALDVPGLAGALAGWMEAVGLRRAALVGHSLGCQIIAALALRRPELVARAVLVAPTPDPGARTMRRQVARLLVDGTREKPSLALLHVRDYAAAGPRRALRTFRFMLQDRIEDRLPRMRMPTLVVRGGRDPVVSPAWAERTARLLPDGRLRVLPGAAHAVHWDAPLQAARVVRAFLREAESAPAGSARASP